MSEYFIRQLVGKRQVIGFCPKCAPEWVKTGKPPAFVKADGGTITFYEMFVH